MEAEGGVSKRGQKVPRNNSDTTSTEVPPGLTHSEQTDIPPSFYVIFSFTVRTSSGARKATAVTHRTRTNPLTHLSARPPLAAFALSALLGLLLLLHLWSLTLRDLLLVIILNSIQAQFGVRGRKHCTSICLNSVLDKYSKYFRVISECRCELISH